MKDKELNSTSQKFLTPSMEDYLEAIFNLENEKKVVRVKDVAKRLGVRMPTVTSMLKTLSKRKLIDYKKYEYLELTDEGVEVGREINRRHHVLRRFLMGILNIDPDRANEEACKMEHAISTSTLDRFIEFMEFVQSCPRAGANWIDRFEEYRLHSKNKGNRLEYMKKFIDEFKERMDVIENEEDKSNGAQQS